MNRFKILIVEDDPGSMLTLESAIFNLGYSEILTADNSETALEIIDQESPALLLLDIQIKGKFSGIEIAQQVKHLNIPIIFITGVEDPAIYKQAKELGPHAYLIKPFNALTLETAIDNVVKSMGTRLSEEEEGALEEDTTFLQDSFFIKNGSVLQKVQFSEIKWIQSEGNYCTLFTKSRKYAIRISLSRLIKRLPADTFVRIHKSYLVQANLISRIDTFNSVIYINEESLPLGRTYKDGLMDQLNRI